MIKEKLVTLAKCKMWKYSAPRYRRRYPSYKHWGANLCILLVFNLNLTINTNSTIQLNDKLDLQVLDFVRLRRVDFKWCKTTTSVFGGKRLNYGTKHTWWPHISRVYRRSLSLSDVWAGISNHDFLADLQRIEVYHVNKDFSKLRHWKSKPCIDQHTD